MRLSRGHYMNRRAFLAGTTALAALGASGLSAAGQEFSLDDAAISAPADGPLRWLDTGDVKALFFKPFFEAYGKSRGIEVVYDALPWSEVATVVPLAVRNGNAHDAFVLPLGMPAAFAVNEGWVRPFDDLIPDFQAWKAKFPAGTFLEGLNVFNGKTYGLTYTSNRFTSAHILYNRPYLHDAGFDPETTPLNWDTFREAARKVTENSKGRAYGMILGGAQTNRWGSVLTLANMAGAACGDTSIGTGVDFRTGEVIYDSAEMVGAVELLLAIKADGSWFPGDLGINAPQARALMPQGVAGMILQGPWNVPLWEGQNPDFDFGVAPPPAPANQTPGHVIVGSVGSVANSMFINAKAKNPQFAADVFHYLGTEQGQVDWGNVVGPADAPVFPSAATNSTMSVRSKAALALMEKIVRVGPNPFVRNPQLAEVTKVFQAPTPDLSQTVQGLFTGQITDVKAQLTALTSATNTALDAAFKAAKDAGNEVSRDDLVFANWKPDTDYGEAEYKAL